MHKDAGIFYDITVRLRSQLSRHHWKLGKPFTPNQEDAWRLLNEVEQMVKLIEQFEGYLPKGGNSDVAYKVRHTLLMHQPAWKSELESSRVHTGSDQGSQGDHQRTGEEGAGENTSSPTSQPANPPYRPDADCSP